MPRRKDKKSPKKTRKTSPWRVNRTSPKKTRKTSPRRVKRTSPKKTRKTSPRRVKRTSPRRRIRYRKLNPPGFFGRLNDNLRGRFGEGRQSGGRGRGSEEYGDITLETEEELERRLKIEEESQNYYRDFISSDHYKNMRGAIYKFEQERLLNHWLAGKIKEIKRDQSLLPGYDLEESTKIRKQALRKTLDRIKERFRIES